MKDKQNKINAFYNKVLPQHHFEVLSIDPIEGTLGENKARHLLSRCMFGHQKEDIELIKSLNIEQALNYLFEPIEQPTLPLGVDNRDEATVIGTTWVNKPYNSNANIYRLNSLKSWWISQLLNPQVSIREKMVLFWHNHFAVESRKVNNAGQLFQYNQLLRENAWGNFRELTEAITTLPAMLNYLDGNNNQADAPNENFARELFELYTLGTGELIESGNYTTFTESDVQEAARVLTGWQIVDNGTAINFNGQLHDSETKIFSEVFNNNQIDNEGENEYKSLIEMIFNQDETARFIVRKLYRWFVYYVIDEEIETNIIQPLAEILRDNNYDIEPVLKTLLSSQHFFDLDMEGCLIKNPVDLIIGTLKSAKFQFPSDSDYVNQYAIWLLFHQQIAEIGMELGNPPDVAGWPAYFQNPEYHQLWINAFTISQRAKLTNLVTSENGINNKGVAYYADLIGLAESTSDPSNANTLINELTDNFFPKAIQQQQKDDLKEILLPGLPDSEWKNEWQSFQSNPNDESKKVTIERKIRNLVQTMFKMAEYQLS